VYEVASPFCLDYYTTLQSLGRISRVPPIFQMACPDFTEQAICLTY